MRGLRTIAWSAVVLVGLVASATMAQANSLDVLSGNNLNAALQWGFGENLPSGSYQSSCQDIRVKGDRLEALCQKSDGSWRRTSLDDFNRCRGHIANDDGRLKCVSGQWQGGQTGARQGAGPGGYGYGQGAVPQGDYMKTCQNARMNGNRLEARCQTVNGRWRDTSVDMRQCGNSNITNNDGQLRCGGRWQGGQSGRGQGPGASPQGGPYQGDFRQSCQDVNYKGDQLRARCQKRDGSWRSTTLDDYRKCRGQIVNDDGHLRCER